MSSATVPPIVPHGLEERGHRYGYSAADLKILIAQWLSRHIEAPCCLDELIEEEVR